MELMLSILGCVLIFQSFTLIGLSARVGYLMRRQDSTEAILLDLAQVVTSQMLAGTMDSETQERVLRCNKILDDIRQDMDKPVTLGG